MGYSPDHKRIKPRTVKPTAKQKRYHIWVMDEHDCMGCGAFSNDAHHPLMQSPLQKGRRDHEFVVPVCRPCHTAIHVKYGCEEKWAAAMGCELPVTVTERLWREAKAEGRL
jgi:hypothetical protein